MMQAVSLATPSIVFMCPVTVTRLTAELTTQLPEVSVILLMVFITKSVERIIIDHLTHLMQPVKMIVSPDIKSTITRTCIERLGRKTTILIPLVVTDLRVTDRLVLRTETRCTMKGILTCPLTGMTTKKEVRDFLEATSTSAIIRITTEPKKKFAVLWGITPRPINIVAAQEMSHIVIPIGMWSEYHAGNVRSPIMEAVTGATDTGAMPVATNAAEVQLRLIAETTMERILVTVTRRRATGVCPPNWKSGSRDVAGTLEMKPTIHLLQWGDQEPYL
jgi:hypothetical protein